MLSTRVVDFVECPVREGFDEDRVWELFDSYVALYAAGDLEELERGLERHRVKFQKFIQHYCEKIDASPKRLTPAKSAAHSSGSNLYGAYFLTGSRDDVAAAQSLQEYLDMRRTAGGSFQSEALSELHIRQMKENVKETLTREESEMDDVMFAMWKLFGLRKFRQNQEEIVQSILAGHDTFVLMPTGGGKSLCYQLPAVMTRGLTVVVCPLLSLVQDQVRTLVTLPTGGIPATYLSSSQTVVEKRAVYKEISKDELTCKLLYVTPEQLTCNAALIDILNRQRKLQNFARMVIDEAHCVSMWGHDFRPAYSDLRRAKTELFGGIQTVALTATANDKVKDDIIQSLGMDSSIKHFKMSFYRSNLKFIVVKKRCFAHAMAMLQKYIRHQAKGASGIVYCLSRQECEQVAELLNAAKISSSHYHAGMTPAEREVVQNSWKTGQVAVVIATIAFGMGIDNPHVRYVVHFVMPKSLENYYQEAGRAGRDGLRSECILFYARQDATRLKLLIRRSNSDYKKGCELIEHVNAYGADERECRHRLILRYLDEEMEVSSCRENCHVCCGGGSTFAAQCPWSAVTSQEIDQFTADSKRTV